MKRLVLVLMCSLASLSVAQETEPNVWAREVAHPWSIAFEPRVWYSGPSGDVTFPGGNIADDEVDLADLNMDSPQVSPYGKLRIQRGKLQFGLSGSGFEGSNRAVQDSAMMLGDVAIFSGETTSLDFSTWTFEARGMYQVFSYVGGNTDDGRDIYVMRGLVGGGLRLSSVSFDLAVAPADPARTGNETLSTGYDGTFAEPIVAAALEIEILQKFAVCVDMTGGGFGAGERSNASFSIEPTFEWFPSQNVGVEVGYRMQIYDVQDGESPSQFEWAGSMAGIFGGISIRF